MECAHLFRRGGFTLIELLVVITIIAVLAGLTFPAIALVSEKARVTQAQTGAHGILIAITGFQAEYNRLPNPNAGGGSLQDATIATDSGNDMIKILLGQDSARNPKEIPYYTSPMAKSDANGLIATGGSYAVVDPWSTPGAHQYYHIVLDFGGDHKFENPLKKESSKFSPGFIASQPPEILADVGVYSDGNPKKPASSRKPITSW